MSNNIGSPTTSNPASSAVLHAQKVIDQAVSGKAVGGPVCEYVQLSRRAKEAKAEQERLGAQGSDGNQLAQDVAQLRAEHEQAGMARPPDPRKVSDTLQKLGQATRKLDKWIQQNIAPEHRELFRSWCGVDTPASVKSAQDQLGKVDRELLSLVQDGSPKASSAQAQARIKELAHQRRELLQPQVDYFGSADKVGEPDQEILILVDAALSFENKLKPAQQAGRGPMGLLPGRALGARTPQALESERQALAHRWHSLDLPADSMPACLRTPTPGAPGS